MFMKKTVSRYCARAKQDVGTEQQHHIALCVFYPSLASLGRSLVLPLDHSNDTTAALGVTGGYLARGVS
jgi:hypothetical protein